MPGRSCTGNPNQTVSMPCSNTWLLCLPANFQQKHKVEWGKNSGKRWGRERGGKKGEKCRFCLTVFAECFLGLAAKSQQSRAECDVLTVPKYCQRILFQLTRQSHLSENSIGFFAFFFFFLMKRNLEQWLRKQAGRVKSQGGRLKFYMYILYLVIFLMFPIETSIVALAQFAAFKGCSQSDLYEP